MTKSNPLNKKHRDELVNGSGIDPELAELNFTSVPEGDRGYELLLYADGVPRRNDGRVRDKTLNTYRHTESGGWWCNGLDPLNNWDEMRWGCFKPDKPRQDPKSDKVIKYEHPFKTSTRAFFLRVTLLVWEQIASRVRLPMPPDAAPDRFWEWAIANHIPIIITEGAKKAAALLSVGFAAIGLPGINNGYRNQEGQATLIPELEKIARCPVIIAFDEDKKPKTRSAVKRASEEMGKLLLLQGCSTHIASWDATLGKGADDLLVEHGSDRLVDIINNAKPLKVSLPSDPYAPKKLLPADTIARKIAEDYSLKLAYNDEANCWMFYGLDTDGVWTTISDNYCEKVVKDELEAQGIVGYGSHSYPVSVMKALRCDLTERRWLERSPTELLPFKNGVLDLATGKLLPHSPDYKFTWQIDREHNPLASDWKPIEQFIDTVTGGDPELKDILLCWCNAVLRGRSDLQKFLHLIGPGGSGKGTFIRLVMALVGNRNCHTSTLIDWCGNQFEQANAYRKRLVVFPDEDKYSGRLGKFKSFTGGDFMRSEEKGKTAFQYLYDGMVMVASNYPIFVTDNSNEVYRRILFVPFKHPVLPKHRDSQIERKFATCMDAFTNHILNIPDEHVTATILQFEQSQAIVQQTWEHRFRTDNIAAWINDCCVLDRSARTGVGSDCNDTTKLFGSYWKYCQRAGDKPKGSKDFSPTLLDLCQNICRWDVKKVKERQGFLIQGLRLRTSDDLDLPAPFDTLIDGAERAGSTLHRAGSRAGSESPHRVDVQGMQGQLDLNKNEGEEENQIDEPLLSSEQFDSGSAHLNGSNGDAPYTPCIPS